MTAPVRPEFRKEFESKPTSPKGSLLGRIIKRLNSQDDPLPRTDSQRFQITPDKPKGGS